MAGETYSETDIYDTPDNNGQPETMGNGVGLDDKSTASKIWEPDLLLRQIELTWKGYTQQDDGTWMQDGSKAIARDEVIENTINSIRVNINSSNMIAKMKEEDVEFQLLEKIKEIIYSFHDEFSVDEDYLENMVNQVDHATEIFMKGIVEKGHGATVFTQSQAGIHQVTQETQRDRDFFEVMTDKLNNTRNKR